MKVAIVAKGGTSAFAPWDDEEWEIWGMPWISHPRVSRLFDVHEEGAVDDEFNKRWEPYALERYPGVPIYCPESRLHISPDTVPFPYEEMRAAFPRAYFENSIAYMIAFAIYEGATDIDLCGVHMMIGADLNGERSSVMYWNGFAEGRGINLTTPAGSPLFMSLWEAGRYGVSNKRRNVSPMMGAIV